MADPANGVAPIKAEYRRRERPVLLDVPSEQKRQAEAPAIPASQVAVEPKSKRQMKKARLSSAGQIAVIGNSSRRAALLCDLVVLQLACLAQELREQRAAGLCNHIVQGGSCPFADKCRFNHDVAQYLASKGPDLPGACPFSASPVCPFGGHHPATCCALACQPYV